MNHGQRNRLQRYGLIILPVILVLFGWYSVVVESRSLEEAAIRTYQDAQLEVVRNAGRAAEIYIARELELRGSEAIHEVEVEVLNNFVKPIKIGQIGDAWIYSPEYVVFDESEDFPAEYIGKSMAEIFEIQKQHGAWHYEEMAAAVALAREGTGWYVWEPDKAREFTPWYEFLTNDSGREIAAWTPIVVFPGTDKELTWVIGMSAMLPEIMNSNGSYERVEQAIYTMSFVTLVVLGLLLLLLRAETQVKELRQQVAELKIVIDESKKAAQVSEIVESDYFQNLQARAKTLRQRRQ